MSRLLDEVHDLRLHVAPIVKKKTPLAQLQEAELSKDRNLHELRVATKAQLQHYVDTQNYLAFSQILSETKYSFDLLYLIAHVLANAPDAFKNRLSLNMLFLLIQYLPPRKILTSEEDLELRYLITQFRSDYIEYDAFSASWHADLLRYFQGKPEIKDRPSFYLKSVRLENGLECLALNELNSALYQNEKKPWTI